MPFWSNNPRVMSQIKEEETNSQPKHQAKNEITNCNLHHADELTDKLCEACRHLEKHGLIYRISGELNSWWKHHRAGDRKQRKFKKDISKDGKLKEKALAKLTSEEMRVLGL